MARVKALSGEERIEISKVGSIIPEVKVHEGNFNRPMCNFLKTRNIWMIICHGTPGTGTLSIAL